MPKVYLEMCSIQRPLDTMRQTRVRLEAEAVLGVIALCEADKVQLISSEVLELELEQNHCLFAGNMLNVFFHGRQKLSK